MCEAGLTAPSALAAAEPLAEFERVTWGQTYPTVPAARRRAWGPCVPILPVLVGRTARRVANAIESIHGQLRRITKTCGYFPGHDAAIKLIWLALRNITADWGRAAKEG